MSLEGNLLDVQQDLLRIERFRVAPDGVIVDIGGHVGDAAMKFHLLNPGARVVVFEPAPPNRFFLEMNLALNNITNGRGGVEVREEMIWSGGSDTLDMKYDFTHAGMSSVLIPCKWHCTPQAQVSFQVK